jgi:hypothetical protein
MKLTRKRVHQLCEDHAIINLVTINEMAAYIFFNNLSGFRICEDAFYARFNGLDEGFGQTRANLGIIRHSSDVFQERFRMERIIH